MTFGKGAARLCGAAAQLLGWRPGEFWRSTPAELAACLTANEADVPLASREMLSELLQQFPDDGTSQNGR